MTRKRGSRAMYLRLGIDVGGTNTDAVLLDANAKTVEDGVLEWTKIPTTAGLSSVKHAIEELLKSRKDGDLAAQIKCVTIGTTYFLNALIERDTSKLQKVGVLRLASCDFTKNTPPFVDFPPELKLIILGHTAFLEGGLNIDGTLIGAPDKAEVIRECAILREKGIRNIVIVGTFSPIDVHHQQETQVKNWVLEELGDVKVVCSSQVGRIGLLERENAAVLNASMLDMCSAFSQRLENSLAATGLKNTALFVSCNDGTMISLQEAVLRPITIIASGPSNSLIGAASLISTTEDIKQTSQSESMMVIDIGGSTTDAGMIMTTGYPRQGSAYNEMVGVRVNFPMPDIQSIGLGGGSIVKTKRVGGSLVAIQVGPQSVGIDFAKKALCFGGDVMTVSDIAIAAGDMPNFGTTPVELDKPVITSAKAIFKTMLESLVDSIKTKIDPLPIALVGGGAPISPPVLKGTSKVLHHRFASVANAIGAGQAKLSETIDTILPIENGRSSAEDERILKNTIDEATDQCVKKGASKKTVEVIFQDLVSLPYVANKVRVVVQVVGELDTSVITNLPRLANHSRIPLSDIPAIDSPQLAEHGFVGGTASVSGQNFGAPIKQYKPKVVNGEWFISETDLELLALGTYILGCGGGGSPYLTSLEARECLRRGDTMRIVDISSLPKDSLLMPVVCMGSPMIGVERPGGNLAQNALDGMLRHIGKEDLSGIVCVEVGGANGIGNLIVGSSSAHDVPLVDGDLMGRAFPSFEKITPYVFGTGDINELLPVTVSSGDGTNFTMSSTKNLEMVDRTLRALLVEMGCAAGMVQRPMSGQEMTDVGVLRSHSLAWRLGSAIKKCQDEQSVGDVGTAVVNEFGGQDAARLIFSGKIVATESRIIRGQSYGEICVKGSQMEPIAGHDELLRILFKNENLIAEILPSTKGNQAKTLASVPDLIIILDSRTGTAIGVPEYRFGLKVIILAAAPHPTWTSKRGLEVAGPKAFGFEDIVFKSVGTYHEPRSVIEEFS
ncbi:hypothetical protein BJ875DRAFT_459241 [Amylocarpus encephaloides]|uniref:Hydantoinase n=1 Tax=Amylocarpus encephaloides TaxID=45428 RepID=A0A9P7YKW5_9HELO|nr:hypothetical protein BJ875DRAFT_459241 [Amylocarpus encephaloides]